MSKCVVLALVLVTPVVLYAQSGPESRKTAAEEFEDHAVVFEIGAAGDWSRSEGFHPGGTFAFEVTPIENWLELEVGITAIRADTGTEMPFDVLFKKPWRLSREIELMVGAGPEVIHATGADHATFWGLESVIDVMFWPKRNVGWYLEPGYELTFRDGTHHNGLGFSAGLLIGR
ncbi:MAG TPA: hypothetical protein VNZ26_14225 [Vicinamibacterales bacterium]|nr:hypothetical protein [Vicinamibacterales bacterium]